MNQVAALPYRIGQVGVEVLLVTSKTRKRWILPKGKVPQDMLAHVAAAREAWEEAGVFGAVMDQPVGSYQQLAKLSDGLTETTIIAAYPLKVSSELESWPEMDLRRRQWWPINRAMAVVTDTGLRAVIEAFSNELVDLPQSE
ncbi:NUDIX hydrolase [Sphingomonas qilianensis]